MAMLNSVALWLAVLVVRPAAAGLTLRVYDNTVLAGQPQTTSILKTVALSLPGDRPFSAEITGSFSPAADSLRSWSWLCSFEHVDIAFAKVDGHSICNNSAAYNNSASGIFDNTNFRLLSKKTELAIRIQLFHLTPSSSPVRANVSWCSPPHSCRPLPPLALSADLPEVELQRRQLQRRLGSGWGSWLHRDILSVALLPDSAVLTVFICKRSTGICLREAQIDQNGGSPGKSREQHRSVRVGRHAMDHSYSQAYVRYSQPGEVHRGLNVSIEYSTDGPAGRHLDLVVTAQAEAGIDASDYAVAFAGSFGWQRLGTAAGNGTHLKLQGLGLTAVQLQSTAASISIKGS